jgi:hypothetical protein
MPTTINSYPLFSLNELHEALKAYLQRRLPALQDVLDGYRLISADDFKRHNMPYCAVECNGGSVAPEQNGSTQLRMRLNFTFRLVGAGGNSAARDLRSLAIHLSQLLNEDEGLLAGVSPFTFSGWYDASMDGDPAEAYTLLVVEGYCDANMGRNHDLDWPEVEWDTPVTVNEDIMEP